MIARIWHGWTTHENAHAYEQLLESEVFPGIVGKQIRGLHGIELMRRPHEHEVEFVTLMRFQSLDDVVAFVGEDFEQAYVPDAARKILKRFDLRSAHYEICQEVSP